MTPTLRTSVRAGSYHDSVVLMRLQQALSNLHGVLDAGVVMATQANREILGASGLIGDGAETAGPGDLLIAVRAESDGAAAEALAKVDALLSLRVGGAGELGYRPRSLDGALRALPEARWVQISVPGRYAAAVAHESLDRGRNVFLYSDNVTLADEIALKTKARGLGLFVLGPDCGTAILGGSGLGFANRVRKGPVGIVAASGTGLQTVASRLHALGSGVSQAIGLGGRDLSPEVGGISALQALDLLARDPETKVIVLLAKPPAPAVAARLLGAARASAKPVVVNFLGKNPPLWRLGDVRFAVSLAEAADLAAAAGSLEGAEGAAPESDEARPAGFFRGLFAGGTLAYEIQLGLQIAFDPIYSNAPIGTSRPLDDPGRGSGPGHAILDLGADEFTVGRLHPMIDPDLRLRRLRAEAADPNVGLILLDVVLGDGAHADPAGVLAPEIERGLTEAEREGRRLEIAVLVVGTDEDPQGIGEQIETLRRAGARIASTVEELVGLAWDRLGPAPEAAAVGVPLEAVAAPLAAINVGVETFCESLLAQGVSAIHVDWRPPAGGDERLAGILARMKSRGSAVK
ncbi:MAG TPA: acyl-CoA synthetase FdrA [Thermoanaerobaculia bacterium]|jgi:FdrA protein|nr:acyl-CoA synthetase FdrA [Thermoanaerobaculia bacterium]